MNGKCPIFRGRRRVYHLDTDPSKVVPFPHHNLRSDKPLRTTFWSVHFSKGLVKKSALKTASVSFQVGILGSYYPKGRTLVIYKWKGVKDWRSRCRTRKFRRTSHRSTCGRFEPKLGPSRIVQGPPLPPIMTRIKDVGLGSKESEMNESRRVPDFGTWTDEDTYPIRIERKIISLLHRWKFVNFFYHPLLFWGCQGNGLTCSPSRTLKIRTQDAQIVYSSSSDWIKRTG